MKIKTNYVPQGNRFYLTAGKEYTVLRTEKRRNGYIHYIIDDVGDEINLITPGGCAHLKGHTWTVLPDTKEFNPLRYA